MKYSVLFLFAFFLVSCGSRQGSQEKSQSEKPVVTSVNYPLSYFAQRIGGDLIRNEYPVPTDVDPAYWIPEDEALTLYQSADIIFANGAGYAGWMNNVSLPASRIVITSMNMEEKYIPLEDVFTHSHGPEGDHEHTGYAFTTWLDFQIAIAQAKAVKENLVNTLPESKDELENNYYSLKTDLLALHESMQELSAKIEGLNIIGSHPVYQYLSKAYDLNIRSVHFEPGEMPGLDQWKEFDELLEQNTSPIMLWEDEPIPEIIEILNEKGVRAMVFNPCGNKTAGVDFIEMMKKNIQTLQNSISY
jgi:zinc transport system substrate-binding protein